MENLGLKASNTVEQRILDYIVSNASEPLKAKIENGKKTIQSCYKYIYEQARKKQVGNCACVEDKEVFGWAMHYFEEDSIPVETKQSTQTQPNKEEAKKDPEEPKKEKKPEPKKEEPKKEEKVEQQLSIFDL